ncbi:FAD-binding and (Fe-S)-binding domain-containing protein [Nesterenkonia halotolerans]|uniref:D-lactate dehydrogenase (cytochrome) n=1 Tax=Nesterenkonia halotolerans TaxID=225325 RepID=A0ABR9JAA7_9MICC|nr:FAD-binding and (Fe-S)-binding domain-containing protein [Nesterenkonia halotolerans]MBE1515932.1 D-lactate dehydrogenase [Nesterenkonia halotolerans]
MELRTTAPLIDELRRELGAENVLDRAIDLYSRAHDASHYLLIPQVVVIAEDIASVSAVLHLAAKHDTSVTFRSGGTSLSGQSCGAGIQVDTRRGFRAIEVLDEGRRVRVQPGATLRAANIRLARHGRALGPDPASEAACTVGGVIANNSSGMAAGIEHNSAKTLESMTLVLPSGTVVDTSRGDALETLRTEEPGLVTELEALRDQVRADPSAMTEIAERFSMKNTMGYSLDAFCRCDDPVQMLLQLMIGSEGTLGFVAEAVFRTVPVHSHCATGLMVFDSLDVAARALPELVSTGAKALELMDATSLKVASRSPEVPAVIADLTVEAHAAILVEYRADSALELDQHLAQVASTLEQATTTHPVELTRDASHRAQLWAVRKGLYAAVAGARPPGTMALLEDVVVPVQHLARTCEELSALLADHGYVDPVIFGHAKDGNIHFMLTEDTEDPAALERLAAFTEDLVELILRQGGNLKAEHGTGRAMAPFIDRQYSPNLVQVLHRIKSACDPSGVLNPGVVLTADDKAHLNHLKPVDRVDAEVDRCVECGYCEPVCPSRDLTLTPRQRIVVRRERERALARGDRTLVAELDSQQEYDSLQTCAADGMCATACPVGIDTGALVKRLREENRGPAQQRLGRMAAQRWSAVTQAAGRGLDAASRMPDAAIAWPNASARSLLGAETVPLWTSDLPSGGRRRSRASDAGDAGQPVSAIFLPSCQGAMFAAPDGSRGAQSSVVELCSIAGLNMVMPERVDSLCCGTPWSSKGLAAGHEAMAEQVLDAVDRTRRLLDDRGDGLLPVVVDASSCAEGVAAIMAAAQAAGDPRAGRVIDAVNFVAERVLPQLEIEPGQRIESLTLHPTCSTSKTGGEADLLRIARAVAHQVHVPDDWACCGFAGDRGMLHPELTASATAAEAREVQQIDAAAHASSNRACEIAMTRATGRTYRHVLEVAADVAARRTERSTPAGR